MALPRRTAAARRWRCPSCCRCSTSSASRPSTSARTRSGSGTERVYLYDIGVRVRRAHRPRRAASGGAAGGVPPARRRRHRGRRVQPPRAARRAHRPRGRRSCAATASTSARSGSRSASTTSRTPSLPTRRWSATSWPCSTPASIRRGGGAADGARQDAVAAIVERITDALDAIPSLDDDRICRAFLTLIDATVRTNSYRGRPAIAVQARPGEGPRPAAAAADVRDLGVRAAGRGRAPPRRRDRPRRAALERPPGGLPHRGARADEGADGEERGDRADRRQGRLRRQAPAVGRPRRCEPRSSRATRRSSRGLLDLTDNLVGGGSRRAPAGHRASTTATTPTSSSPPTRARRRSATSPTRSPPSTASGSATRSRRVAARATTTRRWASRRAARGRACAATPASLGKDADRDPLTVVGIGDMSGDVFGNGMLRSRHAAASSPRSTTATCSSIPTPIRRCRSPSGPRLFALPRSSWADYDPSLLSPGGGVYPRTLKSIELSPQARARARRHRRRR